MTAPRDTDPTPDEEAETKDAGHAPETHDKGPGAGAERLAFLLAAAIIVIGAGATVLFGFAGLITFALLAVVIAFAVLVQISRG